MSSCDLNSIFASNLFPNSKETSTFHKKYKQIKGANPKLCDNNEKKITNFCKKEQKEQKEQKKHNKNNKNVYQLCKADGVYTSRAEAIQLFAPMRDGAFWPSNVPITPPIVHPRPIALAPCVHANNGLGCAGSTCCTSLVILPQEKKALVVEVNVGKKDTVFLFFSVFVDVQMPSYITYDLRRSWVSIINGPRLLLKEDALDAIYSIPWYTTDTPFATCTVDCKCARCRGLDNQTVVYTLLFENRESRPFEIKNLSYGAVAIPRHKIVGNVYYPSQGITPLSYNCLCSQRSTKCSKFNSNSDSNIDSDFIAVTDSKYNSVSKYKSGSNERTKLSLRRTRCPTNPCKFYCGCISHPSTYTSLLQSVCPNTLPGSVPDTLPLKQALLPGQSVSLTLSPNFWGPLVLFFSAELEIEDEQPLITFDILRNGCSLFGFACAEAVERPLTNMGGFYIVNWSMADAPPGPVTSPCSDSYPGILYTVNLYNRGAGDASISGWSLIAKSITSSSACSNLSFSQNYTSVELATGATEFILSSRENLPPRIIDPTGNFSCHISGQAIDGVGIGACKTDRARSCVLDNSTSSLVVSTESLPHNNNRSISISPLSNHFLLANRGSASASAPDDCIYKSLLSGNEYNCSYSSSRGSNYHNIKKSCAVVGVTPRVNSNIQTLTHVNKGMYAVKAEGFTLISLNLQLTVTLHRPLSIFFDVIRCDGSSVICGPQQWLYSGVPSSDSDSHSHLTSALSHLSPPQNPINIDVDSNAVFIDSQSSSAYQVRFFNASNVAKINSYSIFAVQI